MDDEHEEEYIEDRFEVLIGELIEKIRVMEPGSEQHEKASAALEKLYKVRIEYTRIGMEYDEREAQREQDAKAALSELNVKQQELIEQRDQHWKDLIINTALGLTGIGLPLVFYGIWMNKGFRFEQTGTYTSSTFKNLFRMFKPNKVA